MRSMRLFDGLSKEDVNASIKEFILQNPEYKIYKACFIKVLSNKEAIRACVFYKK